MSPLSRAGRAGLVLLCASKLLACSEAEPASAPDGPNVVVVTLDTLRADHLATYGYPRETAPFLSRMAEQGTRFSNAIVACSHTAPAHASIFTSMSPLRHRVVANGQALRDEFDSMASLFAEAGYTTLAFTSVAFLEGLRSGFDEFQPGDYEDTPDIVVDRAIEYLESYEGDAPFLLWIHIYDPHQPYTADDTEHFREFQEAPRDEAEAFTDYIIEEHAVWTQRFPEGRDGVWLYTNKYDAEIRVADAALARFYDYMSESGRNEDGRWIFLADHGEGLLAHGLIGHDRHIYQEQLHVPLIFHRSGEGEVARVADELVRQVDVLPTVLDWLDVEPPPEAAQAFEGTSLVPILEGDALKQPIDYAFSQRRRADPNFKNWIDEAVYALQNRSYKYIWHEKSADELYDLRDDPLELDNRIDDEPELGARFADTIETLTETWRQGGLPKSIVDGDGHQAELEALGYLDGE